MKFMKIVAISYLVKTLLVGIAWLFIPDLPQRATALFHRAWSRIEAPAAADLAPSPAPAPTAAVSGSGKKYTR